MSKSDRRSRAVAISAGALLAAGVAAAPAPAVAAADDPTLKGLVLSGTCPKMPSDLKNVLVTPRVDSLFVPLRFTSGETFKPLIRWILPYQVSVEGEGLKSRHLVPGEVYTRPGGIPSLRPSTCVFQGATKEDGPFTVEITGTIVGSGALLGR